MGLKIKLNERPLKVTINPGKLKIPTVPDLGPTNPNLYPKSGIQIASVKGLPPVV